MHHRQVTSEQRPQIFVPSQEKTAGKKIVLSTDVNQSTLSYELRRNKNGSGKYLRNKARGMAMVRRRCTTGNSRKDNLGIREALEHARRDE